MAGFEGRPVATLLSACFYMSLYTTSFEVALDQAVVVVDCSVVGGDEEKMVCC